MTWLAEQACDLRVYHSTDDEITSDDLLATPTCGASTSADYSVAGVADSGGVTVTLVTPAEADDIVVIERADPIDRPANVSGYSVTSENTYENRQTLQAQQNEDYGKRRAFQVGVGNNFNNGEGDLWVRTTVPHISDDNAGDPLCVLAKEDPADGFRATFCKGAGGGVCADCPVGECSGGDNDGEECASEEDCPGGGECVGFENCDYISVADGVYICESGDTCPSGCGDGGGGEPCLDCGEVGTCSGGTNDGNPCTDDADCPGGGTCEFDDDVCFGGPGDGDACTDDADCPEGGVCRPNDNVCFGGSSDGGACTTDADCPGLCTDLACVGGPDDGEVCAANADCATACVDPGDLCDGCGAFGPHDPLGGGGWIATLCSTGPLLGEFCSDNSDCSGGICGSDPCGSCGSLCVTNADCGDDCTCDVDNVCLGGANDGDGCTDDTDCAGTCTSGACVGFERDCTTNADCGGVCAPEFVDEVCQGGTNDGDPCTDDADCPGGGTCAFTDEVGVRGPTPPVVDSSIALWDGTSAAFIKASRVTIGSTGFMRGLLATQYTPTVSTNADDSITWQYPPTADAAARLDAGAWYEWPALSPDTLIADQDVPHEVQMSLIAADPDYESSAGRTVTRWALDTYPIVVFQPGVSTNSQLVAQIFFTEPIVCPDDFAGSHARNTVQFTGEVTYSLQKNNAEIGTIVYDTGAASEASPNVNVLATSGGATQFASGDRLDIQAPASADATGANLSIALKCYRSATDEVN